MIALSSAFQLFYLYYVKKYVNFLTHIKYLFKFYKKYRLRFALGTFFVVISNVFALYPAIYTRKAFDASKEAIELSQSSSYDFSDLTSSLLYFGMMLILFALLKGVFMFFMSPFVFALIGQQIPRINQGQLFWLCDIQYGA